jgi:hypothetical protein
VGKGVLLGKKLINSPKYHLALCEIATLYEWLISLLFVNMIRINHLCNSFSLILCRRYFVSTIIEPSAVHMSYRIYIWLIYYDFVDRLLGNIKDGIFT